MEAPEKPDGRLKAEEAAYPGNRCCKGVIVQSVSLHALRRSFHLTTWSTYSCGEPGWRVARVSHLLCLTSAQVLYVILILIRPRP